MGQENSTTVIPKELYRRISLFELRERFAKNISSRSWKEVNDKLNVYPLTTNFKGAQGFWPNARTKTTVWTDDKRFNENNYETLLSLCSLPEYLMVNVPDEYKNAQVGLTREQYDFFFNT
jgi:hypothetical protein